MVILNTMTGAVSTYTLAPQSITPTHMGDALGLYAIGGDLDDDQPIVAEVITGLTRLGSGLKKSLGPVYFSMRGEGSGELIVQAGAETYRYPFPVTADGSSRAKPGMGIRENYLAFGFSNPDGDDFQLDVIEPMAGQSTSRRA